MRGVVWLMILSGVGLLVVGVWLKSTPGQFGAFQTVYIEDVHEVGDLFRWRTIAEGGWAFLGGIALLFIALLLSGGRRFRRH